MPAARGPEVLAARLLERCDFPTEGPVWLAVSGGADSLAMLALARQAGLEAVAVHVDHGLRPGSALEARIVEGAAARFGAAFEARKAPVELGANLEARARAARYAVLPPGVLVAHTADDQAETVLVNLLRGAGLDGLSAMARGNSGVRRPLLRLRRAETRDLCRAFGLTPVEDPTNEELRFTRNLVRHRLLPLMEEIAGRDVVPILCRQARLLAEDANLLDRLASSLDPTDAKALQAAPAPLARRALRAWLRASEGAERHPPSAAELDRVLAVVAGARRGCELPGGRRVARRSGRLSLLRPDPPRGESGL